MESLKKTDISKYWEEWRDAWFVWGMGGKREDGTVRGIKDLEKQKQ